MIMKHAHDLFITGDFPIEQHDVPYGSGHDFMRGFTAKHAHCSLFKKCLTRQELAKIIK